MRCTVCGTEIGDCVRGMKQNWNAGVLARMLFARMQNRATKINHLQRYLTSTGLSEEIYKLEVDCTKYRHGSTTTARESPNFQICLLGPVIRRALIVS